MRTFQGIDEFAEAIGTHLGHSDWRTVSQEQVDLFAEVTDDHQWIHTDPERARTGPFDGPIVHGHLTLSLVPALLREIYRVEGLSMVVNYGMNKVRFPSAVPVGSRLRASAELISIAPRPQGDQATVQVTIEIDGSDKPACVAEIVSLLLGEKDAR